MQQNSEQDKTAVRDAATVVILRYQNDVPTVLMGQRGEKAVFMPNKFVFPGGAVDASDQDVMLVAPLPADCRKKISEDAPDDLHHALAVTAIRELWEETGLVIGQPGHWRDHVPQDWTTYAAKQVLPDASNFEFVFRAITPPGRPRRFDARFFLIKAEHIVGDPDDFSAASDELSHLQWVPLSDARNFDMPFITEVVLAELENRLANPGAPTSVPFFKNDDEESLFVRLYGTTAKD